jgi:hypothetical protein
MNTTMHPKRAAWVGAVLLLVGSCATAPKRAESSPPREKDAPSEKIAAQRAAAPKSLELEANDERWQIDAARERKRQQDAKAAQQQAGSAKSVDVTTPPPPR